MQHDFVPGNVVTYDGKMGEVIARGASRNRYFVQILFKDGSRLDVVNQDINKIKRS
jgi:hypothetical protein